MPTERLESNKIYYPYTRIASISSFPYNLPSMEKRFQEKNEKKLQTNQKKFPY